MYGKIMKMDGKPIPKFFAGYRYINAYFKCLIHVIIVYNSLRSQLSPKTQAQFSASFSYFGKEELCHVQYNYDSTSMSSLM